jgi:hypothetical protein
MQFVAAISCHFQRVLELDRPASQGIVMRSNPAVPDRRAVISV